MTKDRLCMRCRRRESEHFSNTSGSLACPPNALFFHPCDHKNTTGHGMVSSDGKASGESRCDFCGETFKW